MIYMLKMMLANTFEDLSALNSRRQNNSTSRMLVSGCSANLCAGNSLTASPTLVGWTAMSPTRLRETFIG